MKKFKIFLIGLLLAGVWFVVGVIRVSGDKTPDAGFGIINYAFVAAIISGVALLINVLVLLGSSRKNR